MAELTVLPDPESWARAAADKLVDLAGKAIAERGRFRLALSGGDTPRPLYSLLASGRYRSKVDWSRVSVFFADERCVPATDSRSNYGMARELLLNHAPVAWTRVHRIRGEEDPERAATEYAQLLDAPDGGDERLDAPQRSRLDLALLGMGRDGHTASLFPGMAVVLEPRRRVAAVYAEALAMWRVTLTPVALNAARSVLFLVCGRDKAETLRHVLEGPQAPTVWPAQAIQPHDGRLLWLVDAEAAERLEHLPPP